MRVLTGMTLYPFISRCREVVFPSAFQMSEAGPLDSVFQGLNCPGFAGVAIRACAQAKGNERLTMLQ